LPARSFHHSFVFFFQAEDGIRDLYVTGVQTCALPISDQRRSYFTMSEENNYTIWTFLKKCHDRKLIYKAYDSMPWCPRCAVGIRSEERRVGKECRYRGGRWHYKKKTR